MQKHSDLEAHLSVNGGGDWYRITRSEGCFKDGAHVVAKPKSKVDGAQFVFCLSSALSSTLMGHTLTLVLTTKGRQSTLLYLVASSHSNKSKWYRRLGSPLLCKDRPRGAVHGLQSVVLSKPTLQLTRWLWEGSFLTVWPKVRNRPDDQALTVYSLNDLLHYVHAVSGQPQRTPNCFIVTRRARLHYPMWL